MLKVKISDQERIRADTEKFLAKGGEVTRVKTDTKTDTVSADAKLPISRVWK